MPDLKFRYASTGDANALQRLINAAYRSRGPSSARTDETEIIEGARTDVSTISAEIDSGIRYLVGQEDKAGSILACVSVASLGNAARYLSSLAVDAARQDNRIGRALLDEVERRARAVGIVTLRISVIDVRRELIEWYERRGFIRTGELLDFPYDDTSVGNPLRQDLSLVALEKALS